jgi:lipoate---protein ligase
MQHLDWTLPTPEENLAADEALLEECEAGAARGLLRVWEPDRHFVVVGYANEAAREVNLDFCRKRDIPVLRRCSGGGTVLQGPGCLNYSVVLPIKEDPVLESIHGTNGFVLDRIVAALNPLLATKVDRQGQTDLAIDGIKFSGNAQRRRKDFLLFHGCLLLSLDLDLVEQALPMPSRQPDYRANRSHRDFLRNLGVDARAVKAAIITAWNAQEPLPVAPASRVPNLLRSKYGCPDWNLKF